MFYYNFFILTCKNLGYLPTEKILCPRQRNDVNAWCPSWPHIMILLFQNSRAKNRGTTQDTVDRRTRVGAERNST